MRKEVEGSASDGSCKVRILAVGDQVRKALEVKAILDSDGIASEVVPVMRVKPADVKRPGDALLVSIENGVKCGGFGESVGADLKFGWPDEAVCHGTVDELEFEHGFDAASVADRIRRSVADR